MVISVSVISCSEIPFATFVCLLKLPAAAYCCCYCLFGSQCSEDLLFPIDFKCHCDNSVMHYCATL